MEDLRKTKYGKAPVTAEEIHKEFQKTEVFEDLGKSIHHIRKNFFNIVHIETNFAHCIFSSAKSIELILENTREEERMFLMDGTFRITPRGVFNQVLIIYFHYRNKVSIIFFKANVHDGKYVCACSSLS